MDAIVELASAVVKGVLAMIADAAQAKSEAHQAVLDRLQAANAALAGDKTDAHLAVEADLVSTQKQLDDLRAQHQALLAAAKGA